LAYALVYAKAFRPVKDAWCERRSPCVKRLTGLTAASKHGLDEMPAMDLAETVVRLR